MAIQYWDFIKGTSCSDGEDECGMYPSKDSGRFVERVDYERDVKVLGDALKERRNFLSALTGARFSNETVLLMVQREVEQADAALKEAGVE